MIQYWEILAFWQLFHFFIQDSSSPPSMSVTQFHNMYVAKILFLLALRLQI